MDVKMSFITNYFNSAISYTKSALSLCVKATAITVASLPLEFIISKKSGLGVPITAIARKLEFVAVPLRASTDLIQKIMGYVVPSTYYTSNHPFPGATSEECYPTRFSPPQYKCKLFNSLFLAGIPEELLTRGLLQRKILPWVAHQLPGTLANVLNHRITRIALTSLIFAAGHGYDDVSSLFVAGVVYGTVAEVSQSLKIPILAHTMNNAFVLLLYAEADENRTWEIS